MMNIKSLYVGLVVLLFGVFTISCERSVQEEVEPTIDGIAVKAPLFGLQQSYTKLEVGRSVSGLAVAQLDKKVYDSMFRTIAQTITQEKGELVNYYIDEQTSKEGELHYFLVLQGELADGSYLTTGMHLLPNESSIVKDGEYDIIAYNIDLRPVFHWSCRGNICNTCQYDLSQADGCRCSFGIDDCQRYYQDQDPT
ncbi:MAG: hypothetical protein HRU41_03850 [Saprospiraceae bacterium]|nr:hypothetical protein [Saprospiraceae bacterium]